MSYQRQNSKRKTPRDLTKYNFIMFVNFKNKIRANDKPIKSLCKV